MTGIELFSLLPLLLAALVPGCLFVAAFLISRQRARFLTVASVVTTLTAYLAYLAVILYSLLSLLGYDARTMLRGSAILDVVQHDMVSSFMFVLVSTLALIVVRYSRTYLAGQRELDRYARSLAARRRGVGACPGQARRVHRSVSRRDRARAPEHSKVNELVDNEWLHVFQLDPTARTLFARKHGAWQQAVG